MSIADVAARLYSSASYRNTPVSKALLDSVKMNIKFRFSLIGMVASLTGSQALYQIAQQKYLITDEEKKQAKEEIVFKKYVVNSISTLSKQVALIESIVEKNSLMINAIAGDLGYFQGQRRMGPNSSYGSMKSFRAPISSRTVKGKIDIINAELAALKGIRLSQETSKQKEVARKAKEKEKDKNRGLIAAAASATLAALGLGAAGAGAGLIAAGGAVAAGAGGVIASQIGKQLLAKAIPMVGNAFKVSLGFGLMMGAAERISKRGSGQPGILTGDPSDYQNNVDPKLDPIGYQIRQNEIQLRKSIDTLFEEFSKPIDASLAAITAFLAAKYTAEFGSFVNDYRRGKKPLPKIVKKVFPQMATVATTAVTATAAATGTSIASARAAAATGTRIASARAVGPTARAVGEVVNGRIWTGMIWRTIPAPKQGTPITQAPKSTKIRRFLPTKFRMFMKTLGGIRGISKLVKGPGAAALALSVFHAAQLYQNASAFENGDMPIGDFKQSFVNDVSGLLSTGGSALIGGALGALIGGIPGALIGTGGGLLLGFLGGGTFDEMALKLFELLYSGEIQAAEAAANPPIDFSTVGISAPTGPTSGPLSVRNNNPGNLKFVGQSGAIGQDSKGFAIFATPEAGMEAMRKQIMLDTQTRGLTLNEFVKKYAPPNENDTKNYVAFIKERTGLNPNDKVPVAMIPALQQAMILMEGGNAAANYYASVGAGSVLSSPTSAMLAGAGSVLSSPTSAMLAGAGPAGMLDKQIIEYFMKNSESVKTIGAADVAASKDSAARAATQQLAEVIVQSKRMTDAKINKVIADVQQTIDSKDIDDIAYVDDFSFDYAFNQPSFVLK